jgi:methyl-accepting chemotaxis protein
MSKLNLFPNAARRDVSDLPGPATDGHAARRPPVGRDTMECLGEQEPHDEAGAIAAAVRVFEDGLMQMQASARVANASDAGEAVADQATGLLASIAGQTSLMALRAAIEAVRDGGEGKGFAVAAADVKDLAGQMARATDTIVAQVGLIQAAAERAQGGAAHRHRRVAQASAQ